jgi:hypothetical protein
MRRGNMLLACPGCLRHRQIAVLKLGMPRMESASEIEGLRFWKLASV